MKANLEAKRIIIRIWTSGKNPVHPGEDVGHVAIEIPSIKIYEQNLYISLWPGHGITKSQVAYTVPHRWHTLDDDIKSEGREPEIIYCFYTLDRYAMRDKFSQIQESLQGWRLLGNFCVREQDTAESCASLAYKILLAGDAVAKIFPSNIRQSSNLSSVGSSKMFTAPVYSSEVSYNSVAKNPDALVEVLREAKLNEYKKQPETQNIVYSSETQVPMDKSSWCIVM